MRCLYYQKVMRGEVGRRYIPIMCPNLAFRYSYSDACQVPFLPNFRIAVNLPSMKATK